MIELTTPEFGILIFSLGFLLGFLFKQAMEWLSGDHQ